MMFAQCILSNMNISAQRVLCSPCGATWGEEEAIREVGVLAVGAAALTVIS